MHRAKLIALVLFAALAMAAVAGLAIADAAKDAGKPAAAASDAPEMKLPPGWTAADMQACVAAGTPGKMHERLAKSVGSWKGKNMMWMYPGADPMTHESTATVTSIMDGRYIKLETTGELPAGMGSFSGLGIYGYDNVAQKVVATWIDNQGTGIMHGTGEFSPDGKSLTINYSMSCPITGKPVIVREVETSTGENTKTLEMYSPDPKSGKEFKMVQIELTRRS